MALSIRQFLFAITGLAAIHALALEEVAAPGPGADLMEFVQWHSGFGVADGSCDETLPNLLNPANAENATALLAMHGAPGLQYLEEGGFARSPDPVSVPKTSRKPARGSSLQRTR